MRFNSTLSDDPLEIDGLNNDGNQCVSQQTFFNITKPVQVIAIEKGQIACSKNFVCNQNEKDLVWTVIYWVSIGGSIIVVGGCTIWFVASGRCNDTPN